MHDKLEFGESALENMVRLSGKTQEYLTRATHNIAGSPGLNIPAFFPITEPYSRGRSRQTPVYRGLRHYREEPVADVVPQWLKNTVEAMHDKLEFGESARVKYSCVFPDNRTIFSRALSPNSSLSCIASTVSQRYYGKTPMQIINDIRINFAKKQLEITNYSVTECKRGQLFKGFNKQARAAVP
jgi:hypothetical protein